MDDRARDLAVYLNIATERWKRTQYEPWTDDLLQQSLAYLVDNQRQIAAAPRAS